MSEVSERVLLLVGSPKGPEKSSSARLGRLVVDGLEERGWSSESVQLHVAVKSEEGGRNLFEAIDRAELVLLAAPLYVDSLPAPVIAALERVAAHRRTDDAKPRPRFVSILKCGFVEPSQNDTCQRILRQFADRVGLEWVTGVSLGGGGRITKRVREAIKILVEALDLGILVPDDVERLTRKPLVPGWLQVIGGNAGWRRLAETNGVKDRLRARPYERPGS